MKQFKGQITLSRNSRGCYILDTVKGCSAVKDNPRGCYGDCYAQNIASRYGMDFATPVRRHFKRNTMQPSLFGFDDSRHVYEVVKAARKAPFIRIGEMGDPSEDWHHTLAVCHEIEIAGKPIVIITKHWKAIPEESLSSLRGLCINTSVSALDSPGEISYRLAQYERIKPYCHSVLRVVSCAFNVANEEGFNRKDIQEWLFSKGRAIDTVFRPSASNPFLLSGVIKAEKTKFLRSTVLASRHNPDAYLGRCDSCPDMCGLSM